MNGVTLIISHPKHKSHIAKGTSNKFICSELKTFQIFPSNSHRLHKFCLSLGVLNGLQCEWVSVMLLVVVESLNVMGRIKQKEREEIGVKRRKNHTWSALVKLNSSYAMQSRFGFWETGGGEYYTLHYFQVQSSTTSSPFFLLLRLSNKHKIHPNHFHPSYPYSCHLHLFSWRS